MFDIGFPELLLVSVVMLLVFGPERLPEVLRNVGRFVGGARRSFESLRSELEREVGADEIRRELHNARIMEEAKKLDSMVRAGRDEVEEMLGERYAALKEDGRVAPVPGEGNDEATADDGVRADGHADGNDSGSADGNADGSAEADGARDTTRGTEASGFPAEADREAAADGADEPGTEASRRS